jgi:hypothetical protein
MISRRLPPGAGPSIAAITALDGAIAAAIPSFAPLVKDAENDYLKTSYLSLSSLLEAVRLPLLAQQVLITSNLQLIGPGFVVVTMLAHAGGGWRSSSFPVGDPLNPQKVAAAATYGLRINLQQLLALVATDDDGQTASAPAPQPWEAQPPQQQYAPAHNAQPGYIQPAPQQQAPQAYPQSAPAPFV